jgi:putative ABC transport system permease protein
MIKHLIKLVWNRKRVNALLVLEIFVSFLVLFAVCVQAVYLLDNYRRPLGFDYADVWNVSIDVKQSSDDYFRPEQQETTRQLYLTLRDFEAVTSAAGALSVPFSVAGSFGGYDINGRSIEFRRNEVTDDFAQVMGLSFAQGRWFGKDDDGAHYEPIVINQTLAQARFGDEDPVGKRLNPTEDRVEQRVVGVVNEFRHGGEFEGPSNCLFTRKDLNNPRHRPPRNMILKLRPGTTRGFEAPLVARLQAVAKDWSFEVKPLADLRDEAITLRLAPILIASVIAAFLMIMVALGLTGVLWQTVTQRTKEIGVRRAQGATARHIHQQIIGELLAIASFGLLFGVLLVVQLPLMNVIEWLSGKVYFWSMLFSVVLIYALTLLCGLYPSWLATRVPPAEALHYE